eukprot:maker-scaffold1127_size61050-snap-gene-0.10 protein:Tk04744 transcript:maker-scaffold1127_size61050-snap-gene-0.10-mRNA-1 annotation:"PREDICTED: uncharacterized protein K02A2.6-like"
MENLSIVNGMLVLDGCRDFSDSLSIIFEQSLPGNSCSNGLAKLAFKTAKMLVRKCRSGRDMRLALIEQRNTPRATGVSSSKAFFGRRLKGLMPSVPQSIQGRRDLQESSWAAGSFRSFGRATLYVVRTSPPRNGPCRESWRADCATDGIWSGPKMEAFPKESQVPSAGSFRPG